MMRILISIILFFIALAVLVKGERKITHIGTMKKIIKFPEKFEKISLVVVKIAFSAVLIFIGIMILVRKL